MELDLSRLCRISMPTIIPAGTRGAWIFSFHLFASSNRYFYHPTRTRYDLPFFFKKHNQAPIVFRDANRQA
jgi:hypothetical protein